MTEQALWPQLLSSALVGTDRRRCVVTSTGGPLATVVSSGELDPDALLLAAAAVTAARRAGFVARRAVPPQPAPGETRPYVPPAAAERLGGLLDGGTASSQYVREWLELAAGRDLIVAPRHLVPLLGLGAGDVSLRPLLLAVGGQRLRWLAEQGPGRWAWAVGGPDGSPAGPEDWDTGAVEVRTRYLADLRERDADAGRELLADAWPQEKAADLAALIGACRAGLGSDDESWLEKALDDRRAQVREAAGRLLALLPGSAWRQRMADRALACVRADGRRDLEVTPPAQYDAPMRRDGLVQKPPQGMGERAWLLLQVISAAPLDCWAGLDADPAALLARRVGDDWSGILRRGWAAATVAQQDRRWAAALCRAGTGSAVGVASIPLEQLAALLDPDDLAEIAVESVRRNADRLTGLLAVLPRPWPDRVAEAVLQQLVTVRTTGVTRAQVPGTWWALLRHTESGLAPAYGPRVRELLTSIEDDRQRETLRNLAAVLQLRADIHSEFSQQEHA